MDELDLGEAIVKDNELKMAVQLAEMGASDEFHPENYRDEVADRVRGLIQKKIEGEEISAPPPETRQGAQIIDLMEALKASLGAKRAAPSPAEARSEPKRKPARRAPQAASLRKAGPEKSSKTSGA